MKSIMGVMYGKVDVIKMARSNYELYGVRMNQGMCFFLVGAMQYVKKGIVLSVDVKEYIELFDYVIAVEMFGATGNRQGLWWNIMDVENRLKYFDWLIERYRDPVCGEYYPV